MFKSVVVEAFSAAFDLLEHRSSDRSDEELASSLDLHGLALLEELLEGNY